MKKMMYLVLTVLCVIGQIGIASALSGTTHTSEGDPDLTIVFGNPPEFDVTQGGEVPALEGETTGGTASLVGEGTGGTLPDFSATDPEPTLLEPQQDITISHNLSDPSLHPQQESTAGNPVPEPSTLLLFSLGILGLFGWMKRK